jgi:DNA-binding NtrC family response regulator
MANILVVDDDENMGSAFRHFLMEEGHAPTIVSNAQDAVRTVVESRPDLVFMDIRMPGTDGLEALQRVRQVDPNLYVVIMTAYGTSQTSIEAVRLGAFEYLTKPLDLDDVKVLIAKALEAQKLSRELDSSTAEEWEKYPLVNLIGKSYPMQETYKLIGLLTTNDVPALITGERGTGKQLVAMTIHSNSSRREKPFVLLNCSAVDPGAIEAELFGRESQGGGKVDAAEGGTLFIERIAAMPLPLQIKVARFLTDKTFERAGGTARIKADVRVVASTDQDVAEIVRQGQFSLELFDALRVISIHLPPLRSRRNDIPDLVIHFIKQFNLELSKNIRGIDDRVKQMLLDHPWNTNVAELERVVKRACILAHGEVITADDIGDELHDAILPSREDVTNSLQTAVRKALHQTLIDGSASPGWSPFYDVVTAVEMVLVNEALVITNGNQVKAAEILGLNRTTLRKKMNPGE